MHKVELEVKKEKKMPLEEKNIDKLHEALLTRVKRAFPEKSDVKFVSIGEYSLNSKILGVEVKGYGWFPRRYNISARKEENDEFRFVLTGEEVSKRNAVESVLDSASKGFDIFLCGKTVMLAEETLENLLVESDLLE